MLSTLRLFCAPTEPVDGDRVGVDNRFVNTHPATNMNQWTKPDHAEAYLASLHDIPHRKEGESTLLSLIPSTSRRVLDLGCGNGHLLALVLAHCPDATGVGIDLSDTMLQRASPMFPDDRVQLQQHNMDEPLPELGVFDCIVSSFAIHHCDDERKRAIYLEAFNALSPGGVFCNLEHVASSTEEMHVRFLDRLGVVPNEEDPTNELLDMETQLRWLRDIGFDQVDCHWKWFELALMAGVKPNSV